MAVMEEFSAEIPRAIDRNPFRIPPLVSITNSPLQGEINTLHLPSTKTTACAPGHESATADLDGLGELGVADLQKALGHDPVNWMLEDGPDAERAATGREMPEPKSWPQSQCALKDQYAHSTG